MGATATLGKSEFTVRLEGFDLSKRRIELTDEVKGEL